MITVAGTRELRRAVSDIERAHGRSSKRAAANAANKTARATRKSVRKEVNTKSKLPARLVNKRTEVYTADARKPKIQARVRGLIGAEKFSASYHDKRNGIGGLVARQAGKNVRVGARVFPNSFIGFSNRRRRHFVGKRAGAALVFPSVPIGKMIEGSMKRNERKAAASYEREYAQQYERAMAKALRR